MKQIINGKMYNTSTAQEICENSDGNGRGDFNFFEERLYKKKTGEFFLAGEGGPASKYRRASGNGYSGGSKIITLSEEGARAWLESAADSDLYEATFGEVAE